MDIVFMNDREAGTWSAAPEALEQDWWRTASRVSTIGIFILLLGAFLFFARTLVAPIVAAAIISISRPSSSARLMAVV